MPSLSLIALIAANLVPIAGVLFWDWNEVLILALFWIENLIIGAFNVIKMVFLSVQTANLKSLFLTAFFIFHYGFFCSVHGTFLWDLLIPTELNTTLLFNDELNGVAEIFAEGLSVAYNFHLLLGSALTLGIAAIAISHAVSFIEHFIIHSQRLNPGINKLMMQPYSQIMIMHGGLLLGAFAIDRFGSTLWLLFFMVLFKLIVDISQYQQRHKKTPLSLATIDKKETDHE